MAELELWDLDLRGRIPYRFRVRAIACREGWWCRMRRSPLLSFGRRREAVVVAFGIQVAPALRDICPRSDEEVKSDVAGRSNGTYPYTREREGRG